MKALFKTVSVTLVISVAMLFFSSSGSNKVEAAGAGAVISAAAAVSVIGSMIIGIATYLGDKLPVVNVKDFVNSPDFESSISVSEDGTAIFNPPSPFPSKINETVFNATAREAVKEYNSQLRVYVCGTGGSPEGGGKNRIPGSVFNAAVSAAILGALASEALADPDNPTGSAAGITLGVSTVNGKPQKVTTTYEKSTVEVFDYLGLEYVAFESLLDVKCDFLDTESSIYKKPYFITSDNQLYIFPRDIYTRSNSRYNSYYISESSNSSWCSVSGSTYGSLSDVYRSFRFYENNGIFCMAFYCAGKEVSQLYRSQFIYSSPQLTSYPVLFSDKSQYDKIASNSFNNIEKTLYFYNAQNSSDEITGNDILSVDIISAGYFIGNPTGSTLSTAGKMLSGTENAVQGGTKTTYSDLSDIEKAIYALAKQNGKTYEEMLEQSNLVVENGQIYLEGLDGMTHTIENLLTEFDKLLEQGNINNENTAASVEQLKAILEYLKGLNIEGLGEYIRQLETTLDGLKQGDENREAVLQEISAQLTELKENLDTLGFAEVSADIKNISQILSDAASKELDVNEIENIDPDWYIEKFPFCLPFDFYRIITLFVRDPVPPVFTVPIKADINAFGLDQSVDEEIVLDLTIFKVNGVDIVQVVLNFVCILGFVLMLIHITTKFFV
jgi:DNA-binding transcriptional MerR regulator